MTSDVTALQRRRSSPTGPTAASTRTVRLWWPPRALQVAGGSGVSWQRIASGRLAHQSRGLSGMGHHTGSCTATLWKRAAAY
eukprot:223464-Pyramimonas_sp.AAC.2